MFDTIENDQFPPGGAAYAAYVDGGIGNQPNYAHIVSSFPGAHHMSITLFGANADAADVEPGAMSAASVPGWFARQKARGIARPCIYANASTMQDEIVPLLGELPGGRPATRLWTAHYGLGEHICGPHSCGALSVDADGTQWTQNAMGRVLDQSLLLANFFGAPAPAATAQQLLKPLPTVREGSTGGIVRTIQGLCCARGHAVTIDSGFGPLTLAALRDVQAAAKVSVDGVVGPATWLALAAWKAAQVPPVLAEGAAGALVRTVQGLLCARGYTVTVDGSYGPATAAGVEDLQRASRLGVDGIVGAQTYPALLGVA